MMISIMKKIIICLRSFNGSLFALVAFRYEEIEAPHFLDSIVIEIKEQDYSINKKVIDSISKKVGSISSRTFINNVFDYFFINPFLTIKTVTSGK